MGKERERHIVQCQDCGGITLAWIRSNGEILPPTDLLLGGCENHNFVVLDGVITESDDKSTSLNTIFELLTEERRRYVLYYLCSQNRPIAINDVVEQVANWEAEEPPETIPPETYDNIEVTLQHHHLPKLDSVECIDYDHDMRCIYLRGPPPVFEIILTIAKLVDKPDQDS